MPAPVTLEYIPRRIIPNPRQLPYEPRGAALELMLAKDPELIIAGPAGTGKSRGALEKLHLLAKKYPGMRGAIVRKTRRSLTQSAMITFARKVATPGEGVRFHGGKQAYLYPNGSEVVVDGLSVTSRVLSTEFDFIFVMQAEELQLDDWEALSTRIRDGVLPYGQLIGDVNPQGPAHWARLRATVPAVRADGTTGLLARMIDSKHTDNPALYNPATGQWTPAGAAYMERLDRLTGVRRKRLRDGLWVAAEGQIYPEWDRAIHWVPRFPIPAWWPRYRVIDFGYTLDHPFVCQWWALAPDGQLILYRELYAVGQLVSDLAEDIVHRSRQEHVLADITDHDAEDRATYERVTGTRTIAARKAVGPGIQAMTARLRVQPSGRPGMVVFHDSVIRRDATLEEHKRPIGLVEEIEGYVWAATGRRDLPLKKDDHGPDAARYMVMAIDGGQSQDTERAMQVLEDALNA